MRHCSPCNLEYQFEKFCTGCGHELEQGRLPLRWKRKNPRISVARVVGCLDRMKGFAAVAGFPMAKRRLAYFASTWKKVPRRRIWRSESSAPLAIAERVSGPELGGGELETN